MTRPLPKGLQQTIAKSFADRFEEGWTEQDGFNGDGTWSHWIYLKPGWRNQVVDPMCPVHIIHESLSTECVRQLKYAVRCNCKDCRKYLRARSA